MASAADALHVGALERINQNEQVENPIVQCVQIKPMGENTSAGQRFRVVWNDSRNFIQSMITQQISWMVTENKLQRGSICKLKSYQANMVKEKTYVMKLLSLGRTTDMRVGF